MNILLIHQNFPGQFKHLAPQLSVLAKNTQGRVIALGAEEQGHAFAKSLTDSGVLSYFRYRYLRGNEPRIHPWLQDIESKTIRAESCAAACIQLKTSGFEPDLIIQHSGWGEGMCLNLVFPKTPILSYQEFFYNCHGFDFDFDPEFQANHQWSDYSKLQLKQAAQLLALEQATWNLTPTYFQRDSFPKAYQDRFSVIHDGINCQAIDTICAQAGDVHPQIDSLLNSQSPIITCVMRSIEPYRGCHTLIRSIPELQQRTATNSQLVIVGDYSGVSYGSTPASSGLTWKDHFLEEIHGHYDPSRVHFLGRIGYSNLIRLLKRSNAHIYLTYPFVLSWSLLESMACRCAIVGSNTAPVREVIEDEQTGLLTDFFDPSQLARQIARLLDTPDLAKALSLEARRLIEEKYDLRRCLSQQLALVELVASRAVAT
jgi:glycosyltransferase involved in cell wall biosynthesis